MTNKMGLFYKREQRGEGVFIQYKRYWLLWVLILFPLVFFPFVEGTVRLVISYTPIIIVIVFLVDTWKIRAEIREAMKKQGCDVRGSKFSISNPLTVIVKKSD